jgi:hypothetical protein
MGPVFRHPAQPATAGLALALAWLVGVSPIADLFSADAALPAGVYDAADADAAPSQAAEPVLPVTVALGGRPDGGAGCLVALPSAPAPGPAIVADWHPRAPPAA